MQTTSKSLRLHIGIFGRRNVGKSSLLNSLVNQEAAIVSPTPGTTTDPVEKPMEFPPLGPALFIDTAGLDDTQDALGRQRVDRSLKVIKRVDLAILLTDHWQAEEQALADSLREKNIPLIIVAGKADLRVDRHLEANILKTGLTPITYSTVTRLGIPELRQAIVRLVPETFLDNFTLTTGLLTPGGLAILVTPLDLEAPKGRLILPQVQTIRDILDRQAYCMVLKENDLEAALKRLNTPPDLVITDSKIFRQVADMVPQTIPLTSFSILFARLKGDLPALTKGALQIDQLLPGDKVLIAEACTHHPVEDDIARVKIPQMLNRHIGGKILCEIVAGADFPKDLNSYRLIIHCGACMFNRRHMLSRIEQANAASIPISNYGMAFAHCAGILPRALQPFPETRALLSASPD